jgi:hypothetical protein
VIAGSCIGIVIEKLVSALEGTFARVVPSIGSQP